MDLFLKLYPDGAPVVNYGVTTVVIGDCGASCAPVPQTPATLDILVSYLRRVMDKYVDPDQFEWKTFGDYLNYLEGRVGINVGAFIPHSPVRLVAMKDAAMERVATPGELKAMLEMAQQAWDDGAIGFSTSPKGGPAIHSDTPSTFADRDEMMAFADLIVGQGGIWQTNGARLALDPETLVNELTTSIKGRHILNEWAQPADDPEMALRMGDFMEGQRQQGQGVYGVVIPYRHIEKFRVADFYAFAGLPEWDAISKEPENLATSLADPDTRARIAAAAKDHAPAQYLEDIHVRAVSNPSDDRWIGRSLGTAARESGTTPMEFVLSFLARNAMDARFVLWGGGRNSSLKLLEQMITHPCGVIGTDAGAHLDRFFFHGAPAKLLGYWSRERQLLSLEQAVHKLTGFPAQILGTSRGVLEAGRPADLVLFDPDTIDDGMGDIPPEVIDVEEVRRQPPGVHLVVVNGQVAVDDGVPTEQRAGRVRRWEL
ncbi:MAG: N-acyl-D-aspartate/D-glutamate deacylase/Dihydroorotase [Chloroflexi bacterium]|nr:MAG: N-acyl-D-aspartate/D-glutamate deacylase/Dihydroorotase [Chloroflexota bacterium]